MVEFRWALGRMRPWKQTLQRLSLGSCPPSPHKWYAHAPLLCAHVLQVVSGPEPAGTVIQHLSATLLHPETACLQHVPVSLGADYCAQLLAQMAESAQAVQGLLLPCSQDMDNEL